MKKHAVVEIDLSKKDYPHRRLHVLWMPEFKDPGFYRQGVSYDAFFNSSTKRTLATTHGPNWRTGNVLYNAKRWDEFESDCQHQAELYERLKLKGLRDDRQLPTVEHQSIWEFYETIGYDYKSKRWWKKCEHCNGTGRIEHSAFYYGVVECSGCDGSGYVLGGTRKRQR